MRFILYHTKTYHRRSKCANVMYSIVIDFSHIDSIVMLWKNYSPFFIGIWECWLMANNFKMIKDEERMEKQKWMEINICRWLNMVIKTIIISNTTMPVKLEKNIRHAQISPYSEHMEIVPLGHFLLLLYALFSKFTAMCLCTHIFYSFCWETR